MRDRKMRNGRNNSLISPLPDMASGMMTCVPIGAISPVSVL